MTPRELRTDYVIEHNSDYHLDPNLITSGRAVRYIEWLEKKVIDLTESLQFQQDMNALAVGPDVCPKCGSEDIVTTIYCNKCNQTV